MGTPAYMAPELVSGEKPGIQSDIYSLGITFYELICGESPFKKENTAASLQSILNDTLPDIKEKRPDAPDWLAELVNHMCLKASQERPVNIAEIIRKIPNYSLEKSVSKKEKKKSRLQFYFYAAVFIVLSGLFGLYFQYESKNQLIIEADSLKEVVTPVELKMDTTKKDTAVAEKQIISSNNQKESLIRQSEAKLKDTISTTEETLNKAPTDQAYGEVFIHCVPWANIYINDDSIGQTPLNKNLKLKAGTYLLELRNPNYLSQKKELIVSAGQNDTINIQLLPAFGYLDVDVRPWAKIYLNDEYKDDTPLKKPIVVQAGTNIIKMINPQYGTIVDTLYIEPGKTLRKIFTYKN